MLSRYWTKIKEGIFRFNPKGNDLWKYLELDYVHYFSDEMGRQPIKL